LSASTLEDEFPETPPLYPGDQAARDRALELEDLLDEQLGPHIRRAWFAEMLKYPDYAAAAITSAESERTRRRYRRWFWALAFAMRRDMKLSKKRAVESWAATESILDRIAAEIGGSGYLAGDAFSIADLTACSLMAPVLPAAVCPLAPDREMPDELEAFRARVADHPAVEWAAGIIRRHR
jgi:glutathione S-transferase